MIVDIVEIKHKHEEACLDDKETNLGVALVKVLFGYIFSTSSTSIRNAFIDNQLVFGYKLKKFGSVCTNKIHNKNWFLEKYLPSAKSKF